jgi:methylated-DNA-protein-cysteine methyltransferase-like protein
MSKSPFYARIKNDVLKIVAAIPPGRVCTYAAIGAHLDVAPRHVAYILSTLEPLEKERFPWHRVVGADGRLGTVKRLATGETQAALLREEGVPVVADEIGDALSAVLIDIAALGCGVDQQTRPADAPVPGRAKRSATHKPEPR